MIEAPGTRSEIVYRAGLLLVCSNVFMTFGWYAHLRDLAQLKILQEVITLAVFVPFAVIHMREPVRLDYLWATLCLVGAVYFVFRGAS